MASERSVALMSDHGFGKYTSRYFFANQWLAEQGHLAVSPVEQSTPAKDRLLDFVAQKILKIPGSERLVRWAPSSVKNNVDVSIMDIHVDPAKIDWSRTQAKFHTSVHASGQITISDHVDETDVLIEKILNGLRQLTDPQTGVKIIDEVYRGKQRYAGPDVTSLPDILFTYTDNYNGSERIGDGSLVKQIPHGLRPPPTHAMDGFYVLTGKRFDSCRLDANIVDIMPTMYRAMGVAPPERTDGKSLTRALSGALTKDRQEYEYNPTFTGESSGEEEVRGRLEDLGYL